MIFQGMTEAAEITVSTVLLVTHCDRCLLVGLHPILNQQPTHTDKENWKADLQDMKFYFNSFQYC